MFVWPKVTKLGQGLKGCTKCYSYCFKLLNNNQITIITNCITEGLKYWVASSFPSVCQHPCASNALNFIWATSAQVRNVVLDLEKVILEHVL